MRISSAIVWCALFGAVVVAPSARAADPLREAEMTFARGEYADAVMEYEALVARAPHDPALLYNLATAYARDGQIGFAVWRYLQVLRLDPRDRATRENLSIIAPNLAHQMALTPIPPVNWLAGRFTANEWAAVAGGSATLAMFLAAIVFLYVRDPQRRRALRRLVTALAAVAILSYPFALMHYYEAALARHGVIVAKDTITRTGASEQALTNFPLPEGTVVRIEPTRDPGWVKIETAGRSMGFVQRDRVRYLSESPIQIASP